MDAIQYPRWLQHKALPMKVSTSQEVGLVSKLKAARLIEAKMEAPPDARGRY